MTNSKLLKIGITGSIIAAICCFTSFLVVLLGALGLSACRPGSAGSISCCCPPSSFSSP
jgi:hypothetical protein